MTTEQKEQIRMYRGKGLSYIQITKETGISINSIKTFCKRNGLGGVAKLKKGSESQTGCKNCGKEIKSIPGRRKKVFCGDKCRNAWWNSHPDLVNKKANYECVCANCGKLFVSYGNKNRRYCTHKCYIAKRFGGDNDERSCTE